MHALLFAELFRQYYLTLVPPPEHLIFSTLKNTSNLKKYFVHLQNKKLIMDRLKNPFADADSAANQEDQTTSSAPNDDFLAFRYL